MSFPCHSPWCYHHNSMKMANYKTQYYNTFLMLFFLNVQIFATWFMTPCQLIHMDDRAKQVELSASPSESRYEISVRRSNIRYCVFVATVCTVPEGWNGLVFRIPFLWDDAVSTCSQNPMFRDIVGHSPSKVEIKFLLVISTLEY